VFEIAEKLPANAQIRVQVKGEDLEGRDVDKVVMLPVGEPGPGVERLKSSGLELREEDGKVIVDNVVFGSTAERQKIDLDYEIASVQVESDRPPKQLFYIPAILLFVLIVVIQRRRRDEGGGGETVTAAQPA
jgi:hypothetical protein